MATVTVVYGPYQRDQHAIKVTPGTLMRDVLDEVCRKLKRDPHAYALEYAPDLRRCRASGQAGALTGAVKFCCRYLPRYRKRPVDLSLAFRLANLPSGAKLDLVESTTGGK